MFDALYIYDISSLLSSSVNRGEILVLGLWGEKVIVLCVTDDGIYKYICVGICKAATEEHGRHLPIMNGIKEDIKSIGVLDNGSPSYLEAFTNLSKRLKSLLVSP